MKEGWRVSALAEVTTRISDGSHNPPKGVEKSQFLMLSSKNVLDDEIRYEDPRYLSRKDFEVEHRRTTVTPGDVLLTIVGTVGRTAVVPSDAPQFTLQRSVAVLKPRVDRVLPRFLMYGLMHGADRLNAQARGVAQKGIYLETLRDFGITHPSLANQRRVVDILDEAFGGIATAKTNSEKNIRNARALFHSGFGGITTHEEQRYWLNTTVAAIAEPRKGSIRTGPFGSQLLHGEFVDQGIAVLGIDNAVANEFRWGRSRFITAEKYRKLDRYRVYPGDVLITIMGTCGRCAVVPDDIPLAINTKHLCCITVDKSKCVPEYLHAYFLYHPMAQQFLLRRAKGSIMSGLNMGIIRELPVLLPPLKRQREIVVGLDALKHETQRLESIYQQKFGALDALRKSLLHRAYSGEL